MQKHFALTKILAAALGLLFLAACANPLITPREQENYPGEISWGTGLVSIETGTGAARTAMPGAVFDHYEYIFNKDGGADQTLTPTETGGKVLFELEPGNWSITVKAYAEAAPTSLAAQGSEVFTALVGQEISVTVTLSPVASEGQGTLNYALTCPDGAAVVSFTLTRLADTTGIDLSTGATATVDAGYYVARAVLSKDGIKAAKQEVTHIYKNLTTTLSLEFFDSDFKAILVLSSANEGPNTLREAITNANASAEGATIVIDLPPGDRVITLTSALPAINKSLTILGNGATLTQSGLTGSLLTATGNLHTVLEISRIHFKGGRAANGGAINATATLHLESCIFSDNQATGNGGAIAGMISGTIKGSTFYRNSAAGTGGAVTASGASLAGNIFFGNSAPTQPIVNATADKAYSEGFNLYNGAAGWTSAADAVGDKRVAGTPVSSVSFKPIRGIGADSAERVITARPADYPVVDFYGALIPALNAAAGAVQTPTAGTGFMLDYAALGTGTINVTGGTVDADGLSRGSVTFTANNTATGEFRYWLVNGERRGESSNALSLTINSHTVVQAVFYFKVIAAGDNVPGSLREALGTSSAGIVLPPGTLTLASDLTISSGVIIEGSGTVLDLHGNNITTSSGTQPVKISRVLFTGGKNALNGGAIRNTGILTLESCIFSFNQTIPNLTSVSGGALHTQGNGVLTVSGCTFYGNSALYTGGAVSKTSGGSGSAIFTGNLFWGNTVSGSNGLDYTVVSGSVASLGYNITDKPPGTGAGTSGLSHETDAQAAGLPFSSVSFKPFAGGAAIGALSVRPEGYPTVDFYGNAIPATGAAVGAAQSPAGGTGYVLDYAAQGPGRVELTAGTVDADGFVSGGSVTLTAYETNTAAVDGAFSYWLVDGEQDPEQSTTLTLSGISAHTTVRAVFTGTYRVTSGADSGSGSFREALGLITDGDAIVFSPGLTVTLTEPLPATARIFTIQGNGATLTQSGFTPSSTSQLFSLSRGADVGISRVHFKGARATGNYGGAIYGSSATLRLESCIFSDNQGDQGGAVGIRYGSLSVYGCTFYGNSAANYGAVYYIYGGSGSVTVPFAGNLFWGNTPSPAVYLSETLEGDFNITDQVFDTGSSSYSLITTLPITPVSFKPLAGSEALGVVTTTPQGYPAVDFYGTPIPSSNAAAGAVQTAAAGNFLDYAAVGPGTVTITSGSPPDADGVVGGSVTLTATDASNSEFSHWTLDGLTQPTQTPPNQLTVDMNSGSKIVRAFFAATWTVTSPADSGAGSLRQNLADALDGDTIVLPAGQTITLATPLDPVNKSFVIKGNGATLTQSGFTASTTSQLLRISGASTTVSISRLHFKGGRVTNNGGAISNAGKLTLESCIFSDNQATLAGAGYGGAVYTAGTNSALTVTGCTFYGNKATGTSSRGGAVYKNSGALTLAGNIFWDNTASSYPVVYGSSVASDGFNVSDKPGGATASGWTFATGAAPDTQASSLPVSPVSFKPLSGSEAAGVVTALPGGYPDLDFYGQTITAPAAAGAVQGAAAAGFVLTYSAVGPGTVALTNGAADSDGLTSDASVTLRATPVGSGASFIRWLVNGATHPETSAVLNLTMDGHKTVKAVFATVWTVTSPANSGAGSLYQALTDASDGELISISLPPGQTTITLTTALPQITKSLTIEGNGATLTQSGFTASATSQLLYISSATAVVSISRLHFTGGRGINAGAAIYNAGILTLESCIFSGNQTTMNGGAVYTTGAASALTIAGCTFYGNAAGASSGWGGAVYKASGALTLTGNLFWGNTASGYPVVYGSPVVSGGFNVSDKPGGTGSTASNWTFVTGDKQVTALPLVPGSFKPFGGSDGAAGVLTARPANYPSTDFYGISISDNNAAAGAVQTTVTGFKLEYSPVGLGTVALTSGTVDSDGLTSDTSVTLTATAAGSGTNFARWVVNETTHPETSAVLNLTMDGHKTVKAVFVTVWPVTSPADSGAGSLRQALTEASDGDTIVLAGQTITLETPLDPVNKSLAILGNGATLTQTGFTASTASQLLYIGSATADVSVSRLHFKGGRVTNPGGAIYNAGNLTLESCIFSDNQATLAGAGYGGAVYTTGTNSALTVTGCTFYGNKATGTSSRGGAVYKASGALTLAGNIFWDNTAAAYPVLYTAGTTPVAKGFNVSDKPGGTGTEQSGWAFATGAAPDTQAPALPVHPSDFKPLSNGAAYQSISAKPEGYPGFDFYGVSIPDINAMVGAVQTAIITSGYMLDSAPQGGGVVNVSSGTPDGYGFYSGSVTLTATDGLGVFQYWTVNGERQPDQSPPTELTLAMDGPKTVRAVFVTAWTVNSAGNDGAGSLRDALERAQDGDTIVLAGQTITLETPLDPINKSLTILGNGATLTQSGFTASTASQLLYIGSATAEVSINRLHFKGGRVTNQGGAIYNAGNLTLESCIFSDNQATLVGGYGGAVYTTGTGSALTVTGCTFYGNKATGTSSWGGAVYKASGTLTLAGNIFWGNTAATYPVLYTAGTTPVTKGFNVSDQPGGTGTVQSGWTFAGTDTQGSGLPVYPSNFKPLSSGAAYQRISSKPDGYPAFDFYGDPIPASNAMAGAVQAAIVTLGYMLDYAAQGGGTVSVTSGTPDGYGFYSGSVTLTATDGDGGTFQYWTLNGERQPDQTTPNVLSLSMDGHKTVRAVFATTWTVTSTADSGVGTLRQAINDAAVGESIILPAGQTITLTAMLTVNKSLVIEGNGATLTQSGLTTGAINQLLSITGATTTVRISRLHFTGGRSKDYGSAIRNAGILTLESCIFSDNVTDYGSSYSFGGAIATTAGSLTVLGCTFTENSSLPGNSQGAAIFRNGGTLSLTGNIFAGNIAGSAESTTSYPVVYGGNSNTTTGGYNVSDKATGTSSGTSGWTFNTDPADVTLTDVTFDTDFKPSSTSNGLPVIPDLPAGFPATYFNGADRGSNSTPGAMPKN